MSRNHEDKTSVCANKSTVDRDQRRTVSVVFLLPCAKTKAQNRGRQTRLGRQKKDVLSSTEQDQTRRCLKCCRPTPSGSEKGKLGALRRVWSIHAAEWGGEGRMSHFTVGS